MSVLEALLNLFFPPKCPFCGRVRYHTEICPDCQRDLPWTRGDDSLLERSDGLRCCAPLWYEKMAREGVLRLKFRNCTGGVEIMGELIAECAAEWFSGEFDTVTWVPVSRKRLRKRGYDQAELLARAACRAWDTQPVRLLKKKVHNPSQTSRKGAAARKKNVEDAYAAVDEAQITGRRILLVDDVCTTGSTLLECIRVLKEAGAASVVCATLARTPENKEE